MLCCSAATLSTFFYSVVICGINPHKIIGSSENLVFLFNNLTPRATVRKKRFGDFENNLVNLRESTQNIPRIKL